MVTLAKGHIWAREQWKHAARQPIHMRQHVKAGISSQWRGKSFQMRPWLNIYSNSLWFPRDFHLHVCRPRITSVNKELRQSQLENLPKVIPSLICRKIHFLCDANVISAQFPWQKLFRVQRKVLHACGTPINRSGLQGTERLTWKTILNVLLEGLGFAVGGGKPFISDNLLKAMFRKLLQVCLFTEILSFQGKRLLLTVQGCGVSCFLGGIVWELKLRGKL